MAEFLNNHSIKIQLGVMVTALVAIIYWSSIVFNYAYNVESNQEEIEKNHLRIERIENKLDTIATKDDLQVLKQDIKDFIK